MQLIESILADAAAIATIRRDIHAHPELCFEEVRTADVVADVFANGRDAGGVGQDGFFEFHGGQSSGLRAG